MRLRWHRNPEDARDLTQDFFTRALEKEYLVRYDPAKARFRTFLRTCLDAFVANAQQRADRLKRGGAYTIERLDFDRAEQDVAMQVAAGEPDPEACFRQEWIRGLFAGAVDDLRVRCEERQHTLAFALFARYDLEGSDGGERPTYAGLAQELGTSTATVTNQLAWARREFREIVLDSLRALCATDEEFVAEARALLGAVPR